MITEITMYGCKCDNCGQDWHDDVNNWVALTDKTSMEAYLGDDDRWLVEKDHNGLNLHYCPNCWTTDDEDNIIIVPQPSKAE